MEKVNYEAPRFSAVFTPRLTPLSQTLLHFNLLLQNNKQRPLRGSFQNLTGLGSARMNPICSPIENRSAPAEPEEFLCV